MGGEFPHTALYNTKEQKTSLIHSFSKPLFAVTGTGVYYGTTGARWGPILGRRLQVSGHTHSKSHAMQPF